MPPPLPKVERDIIEGACAEQVEDLHRLFVQWFRGTRPLEDLQSELQERLSEAFSHVAPNGQFLTGRQVLLGHLQDKYGCYHDRVFEIEIYNVKLVWSDGHKSLVTYEEWQSWQQEEDASTTTETAQTQQFGRLSTCLLQKKTNIDEQQQQEQQQQQQHQQQHKAMYEWIHVHETWLEDEAPAPTAVRASETRKLAASKQPFSNSSDEDTVMTGPVPQSPLGGSANYVPPLSPMHNKDDSNHNSATRLAAALAAGALPKIAKEEDDDTEEEEDDEEEKEENGENEDETEEEETEEAETATAENSADAPLAAVTGNAEQVKEKNTAAAAAPPAEDSSSSEEEEPPQVGEGILQFSDDEGDEEEQEEDNSKKRKAGESNGGSKRDQETAETVVTLDDINPEERQFMENSKGILVWEDEVENPPEPDPLKSVPATTTSSNGTDQKPELPIMSEQTETPIPNDISKKRHVSARLDKYAKPMMWEGALVGVSIAGFDIGTSQGPIADEAWYKEQGAAYEASAQPKGNPKPRRRVCLPEMVFPIAHVACEGNGVWMSWDAIDALDCWAKCHSEIAVLSRIPYHGVNVLKSNDAKTWEAKRKHVATDESSAAVFHYDWTYSTPYCGTMEGGEWVELDESGMRMELLTDQSVPILFFDEIVLFEDDLHDNGQAQYTVKLRVMPTCAYILARLYVRVDNVVVRVRETRVLMDFFGIKPQVYRDVTWRECRWEDLAKHDLPTEVRPWHHSGKDTPEWHTIVRGLPEVEPPKDVILPYAVLEYSG